MKCTTHCTRRLWVVAVQLRAGSSACPAAACCVSSAVGFGHARRAGAGADLADVDFGRRAVQSDSYRCLLSLHLEPVLHGIRPVSVFVEHMCDEDSISSWSWLFHGQPWCLVLADAYTGGFSHGLMGDTAPSAPAPVTHVQLHPTSQRIGSHTSACSFFEFSSSFSQHVQVVHVLIHLRVDGVCGALCMGTVALALSLLQDGLDLRLRLQKRQRDATSSVCR